MSGGAHLVRRDRPPAIDPDSTELVPAAGPDWPIETGPLPKAHHLVDGRAYRVVPVEDTGGWWLLRETRKRRSNQLVASWSPAGGFAVADPGRWPADRADVARILGDPSGTRQAWSAANASTDEHGARTEPCAQCHRQTAPENLEDGLGPKCRKDRS